MLHLLKIYHALSFALFGLNFCLSSLSAMSLSSIFFVCHIVSNSSLHLSIISLRNFSSNCFILNFVSVDFKISFKFVINFSLKENNIIVCFIQFVCVMFLITKKNNNIYVLDLPHLINEWCGNFVEFCFDLFAIFRFIIHFDVNFFFPLDIY